MVTCTITSPRDADAFGGDHQPPAKIPMPKYIIEREIPGAGKMTPKQLQNVAETACAAVQKMGQRIHWIHSLITPDRTFCVMIAANEEAIREHASQCGIHATPLLAV